MPNRRTPAWACPLRDVRAPRRRTCNRIHGVVCDRGPAICEAQRLTATGIPQLESARLRLRAWREADPSAYAPILHDPEVMRHLGAGLPFRARCAAARAVALVSDVEARRAIRTMQRHWARYGLGEWAVELKATSELIGRVGFVRQEDWPIGPAKTEIGWTLASRAWGNGFATEGARMALGHGFAQLGLDRVISITQRDNVRSRRVMESLGMQRQGDARWRGLDRVWYAIDRGEWLGANEVATMTAPP
jgi:RimJ/RimL family protein N-acetyltransferase